MGNGLFLAVARFLTVALFARFLTVALFARFLTVAPPKAGLRAGLPPGLAAPHY
jgi:hypothetical protein